MAKKTKSINTTLINAKQTDKKPTSDVIEGEVVSGDNIERGKGKIKFNDEVIITDGFYKNSIGKIIGRKGLVVGEKVVFIYKVLLDSIDLVEVYERELRVLDELK